MRSTLHGACALAILVLAGLPACRKPPSDEEQIRQAIEVVEAGFEKADPEPVARFIDEGYRDGDELTRLDLLGLVKRFMLQYGEVSCRHTIESLSVEGELARMRMLAGFRTNPARPMEVRRFELELRRADDTWTLTRASWREVDASEAATF
jgi:hypothetical protein